MLRVSDRPVALCDVPNSVYAVLGLPDRVHCDSLFSSEPRQTARAYYRYPDYFEQYRLGLTAFQFEDYTVDGHAWHAGSWRRTAPPAVPDR